MRAVVSALRMGNGYAGEIAELLIYNRALTAGEREAAEDALIERYIVSDVPVLASATLMPPHFERGGEFDLVVLGSRIASGFVEIDFHAAQGGQVLTLPLVPVDDGWVATGITPANVPLLGGVGGSSPISASITLQSASGLEKIETVPLTLTNDTNAPSLVVDQPTSAEIDAATTTITGTVGRDTTELTLAIGSQTGVSVDFDRTGGVFSIELALREGPNTFTLVARDFLGNAAQVALAYHRTLRPPEIVFAAPISFDDSVNTTSLRIAGTIVEASVVTLTVNGTVVPVAAGGAFEWLQSLTTEGANTLTIVAEDAFHLKTTETRTLYRVTQAPALTVTFPPVDPFVTRQPLLQIAGSVGNTATQLRVNTTSLTGFASGLFTHAMSLVPGNNLVAVEARDAAGNSRTVQRTIVLDQTPPTITGLTPESGFATNVPTVVIAGRVVDGQSLSINGENVSLAANGSFTHTVTLAEGSAVITLEARDAVGNAAIRTLSGSLDTVAPTVSIEAPIDETTLAATSVSVAGSVNDPAATLTLNGTSIPNNAGAFSVNRPLAAGESTFTVQAKDAAGNIASKSVTVRRDTTAPIVAFATPANGSATKAAVIRVSGTVDDPAASVLVNGRAATVADGQFEIADFSLNEGQTVLTAVATDRLGNASAPISITVTSDRTSPSPPALATPPAYIKTDRFTLSGTAEPGMTVSITGGLVSVSATASASGAFSVLVLVTPNKATDLFVRVVDRVGNESDPVLHTVVSDTIAPVISLTRPAAGANIATSMVEVAGTVVDANLASSLTVNGQTVALLPNGHFGIRLTLADGAQSIVLTVLDLAGNQAQQARAITVADAPGDGAPPSIVILTPVYDAVVPSALIVATALIADESPLTALTAAGNPIIDSTGDGLITFEVTVDANGEFVLAATDAQNLTTTLTHRVRVDGSTPAAPTIQRVSPDSPTAGREVILYGSAQAGLRYEVSGGLLPKVTGIVGADGKFTATVPLTRNATNQLQVTVAGTNGLASSPALSEVIQDSVAPSIEQVTPAVAAMGVPRESTVQIVFSEAIRAADIAEVQLQSGATTIATTRSLSADAKTLTLLPTAPFAESSIVRVTVPSSVSDLAGNPLGSSFTYTFTTVDLTTPAAPILDAAPARTASLAVAISGTAEPFSIITISGAAGTLPASADAQGRFVVPITLHPDTANALEVTASDVAGNISPASSLIITHDSQAFALLSSTPAAAATGVPVDAAISLIFNRAVDPASVGGIALVGQTIVPTTVSVEEGVVSIVPAARLAVGTRYEIAVPASVADLFGNRLDATQRIAFTTQGTNELAAPVIYSAGPKGATNQLVATLSGYSAPGTQVLVSGGAAPFTFPASGTIDGTGLFTFEVPLELNAQNQIVLRANDGEGRISAPATALDVRQDATAPGVVATLPSPGAINVDPHASLFVEFSEAIQSGPLAASIPAIRLFDAQNAIVTGSWILSADARSATFYATRSLAPEANFKLLVGTAVRDLAGNALGAPLEVAFTTATAAAVDRPATPVLDPLASTRTTDPVITLTGSAAAGAQLRVFGGQTGAAALVGSDGRFTVDVPLVLNAENPLAIVAEVSGAVSNPAAITIAQVAHAAAVRILSPQAGLTYNNRSLTVAGIIDDPEAISTVNVAGVAASIVGRYFFAQVVFDETAGAKSVTAIATLKDGSTLESSVAFSLLVEPAGADTQPPIPRFLFPEEGDVLNGDVVETLLTVEEGVQLTTVEIDRVVAHQVVGNIFFIHARLPQQGPNAISVNATDAAGHIGTATVNVDVDSIGFATAPTVVSLPSLTNNRVITLTGTAEPGSTIVVLNGLVPVRVTVPPSGSYVVSVPLNPNAANHLQVVATDAAGNLSPVTTVDIVHDDTPPTIVATSPVSSQTGVPQNATIEVTFSEPLNPASIVSETAVVVRSALGQTVQRNVLLSADGKTLRIVPSYKFLRGDTITVELSTTLADAHGFALRDDYAFSFSIAAYRTTVSGIVVDAQLRPLANVKVGILGTGLAQTTSSFGTFLLDDAPTGDRILYVDARPDPATGLSPQGDARAFGYLEFFLPVRQDADNSLGRPIFMVETDFSTTSPLALTGENNELTFAPAQKDLAGLSITYRGGSARFADGTLRGHLTATRIDAANIPDRLPSGAIPHFLVELGPDGLTFDTPARLGFPNVYNLAVGDEVIVFHFKYGIHHYTELGRAVVGADNLIRTGPLLTQSGFVGIVPADGGFDLTRTYLEGRVVDAAGVGLAGVSVNAIAGSSYAVTDASGRYSIALPEVRLELLRTFATLSTDLGARSGDSPSLVFQSELVALNPSGVTQIPDIVVDSFFLGGSIRYVNADGSGIPITGLAYSDAGRLVSVDEPTVRGVEIFVYRRVSAAGAVPVYDSEPYMKTTANLDRFDDTFDASFSLAFLGSLAPAETESTEVESQIPGPGDTVKIVAFDRKTGFYGETDLQIPTASEANGGDTPLDVLADLELRPPLVALDINRVFFLDGIRRRANVPHRGIAFTNDEYVEFKTTWTTPAATPLDRPELSLPGRLRVASIDYQTDYGFAVRGGEQFRVLELREAIFPDRLAVLQRDTDVGVETIAISRGGAVWGAGCASG